MSGDLFLRLGPQLCQTGPVIFLTFLFFLDAFTGNFIGLDQFQVETYSAKIIGALRFRLFFV